MSDAEQYSAKEYLEYIGTLPDEKINLGNAALVLATLSHEGISIDRYTHHLDVLSNKVAERYIALMNEGADNDAPTRLLALRDVLAGEFEYTGDQETYDDLQNASLVRVIDRAKGLPITLSILYIAVARAQGWAADGLNIPGHFLCRIEKDGVRIIFDPFEGAKEIEAHDLRAIIKRALGADAELSAEYYEAASNRDILIRLQNNIKLRQIETEDYSGALNTVQAMRLIAPQDYRLLLDEGVLLARCDQPRAAIDSLSGYIDQAPDTRNRAEAEMLLRELKVQIQ